MAGPFRGKVREARQIVHSYMHVDALYYKRPMVGETPVIREITCRVHDKFLKVGDLAGTNFHYAEMEENSPRAIFMRAEIEPERNYIIATLEGFYRLDVVMPPDDISVTWKVVRLTHESDTDGLIPLTSPMAKYAYGQITLPALQ